VKAKARPSISVISFFMRLELLREIQVSGPD